MNSRKIKMLLLLCCTIYGTLRAQWQEVEKEDFKKAILELDQKSKPKQSYAYKTHYRFYDQLTDNVVKAEYHGYVRCVEEKHYNIRMVDQLIVQNEKWNLTLDSTGQHIIVNEPDTMLHHHKTAQDYDGFLNSSTKVYRQQTKRGTQYLLEFPPNTKYKSIEIELNTKGQVSRLVMMAGQLIPGNQWDEQETLQPRMEIEYSDYQEGNLKANQLKRSEEILEEKEGKLQPTAAYAAYTVVDLRIKTQEK